MSSQLVIAGAVGMEIRTDYALLHGLDGIKRLCAGTWRVQSIIRPVHERPARIVEQRLPVGVTDAVHKPVGVKAGTGDHGENATIIGIHGDDRTTIAFILQGFCPCLLNPQPEMGNQITARMSGNLAKGAHR